MTAQLEWKQIHYDQWVEEYQPTTNEMQTDFTTLTNESDWAYIWTVIAGDGPQVISAGYHYVNAIGYFITKKPHDFMTDVIDE